MANACSLRLALPAAASVLLPPLPVSAASLNTLFAFPNPVSTPLSPSGGLTKLGAILYGTTRFGGTGGRGTVFGINPGNSAITIVHDFVGADGAYPLAPLIVANGKLFGTASQGGQFGFGSVFEADPSVDKLRTIHSFEGTDGQTPVAALTLVGNTLYGTTRAGGAYGLGTIFQVDLTTGAETTLYSFQGLAVQNIIDGAVPCAGMISVGGVLYGTTSQGGASHAGTVFAYAPGGAETILHSFTGLNDGGNPQAPLIAASGTLYGTTAGVPPNGGTVYSITLQTGEETVLHDFPLGSTADGAQPAAPVLLSLGVLYGTTPYGGSGGYGTVFQVNATTQAESLLASFDGVGGSNPLAGLITQGGLLYGTTAGALVLESGAQAGQPASLPGSVFSLNPSNASLSVLAGLGGASPVHDAASAVTLASGSLHGSTAQGGPAGDSAVFSIDPATGTEMTTTDLGAANLTSAGLASGKAVLYGTTRSGGSGGAGTVFSVPAAGGAAKTVYNFTGGADGGAPDAGLANVHGTLYGTARSGGSGFSGTVFSIDAAHGKETTLYAFTGGADGGQPTGGVIEQGSVLYGTTASGGKGDAAGGVVFAVQTGTGAEIVLHAFTGGVAGDPDGAFPQAGVIAAAGNLYGTTPAGGASFPGCGGAGCGVVFVVNPNTGSESVLYGFGGGADGGVPLGGLLAVKNTLYGAASIGGAFGYGTIFSIDRHSGALTTLYHFTGLADGAAPGAALMESGGILYGTTDLGGPGNAGTVFGLTP